MSVCHAWSFPTRDGSLCQYMIFRQFNNSEATYENLYMCELQLWFTDANVWRKLTTKLFLRLVFCLLCFTTNFASTLSNEETESMSELLVCVVSRKIILQYGSTFLSSLHCWGSVRYEHWPRTWLESRDGIENLQLFTKNMLHSSLTCQKCRLCTIE